MTDVLYLAWRYLSYHRLKTAVLVASITTIVYLPLGLNILVDRSSRELTARAEATPLLVGAKGSPLELVLGSLYFGSQLPETLVFGEVARVNASGLALGIPLDTRFSTDVSPIVGTSLEYFDLRKLRVARGRGLGMLGECVVGARAARREGVGPGDTLMSRDDGVFNIAGTPPLKMKVVGVLAPTNTPDDDAVFVDIKTTWIIQGLAHGHRDLDDPEAEEQVLEREDDRITANASVMEYQEVTRENIQSFHFHGDPAEFPITSVIAVPRDTRSGTLLEGRYVGGSVPVQIVQPEMVVRDLLTTVFTVRRYVLVAVALIAIATLATMALVFVLSLQLRRRELETMAKIGAAPVRVFALLGTEVGGVLVAGILLAGVLTLMTSQLAGFATRMLVQLS